MVFTLFGLIINALKVACRRPEMYLYCLRLYPKRR
jgi:hypothetical protein